MFLLLKRFLAKSDNILGAFDNPESMLGHMKGFSIKVVYVVALFIAALQHAYAARILFVGNSFIGFSKPLLEDFARSSPFGADLLEFEFAGGISLAEHTGRIETLKAIRCQRFDYIVLQDHSQRTLLNPQSFAFGVSALVSMARDSGAQPLLFETWARGIAGNLDNFLFHQSLVSDAYHEIGEKLNVPVIHVGDVWREVRRENVPLFIQLYEPDLIHPTRSGQYAVATSVYRTLYPSDLAWAPSNGLSKGIQSIIRNIAIDLNTIVEQHTNPNNKAVCEVSIDEEQRALCGCSAKGRS